MSQFCAQLTSWHLIHWLKSKSHPHSVARVRGTFVKLSTTSHGEQTIKKECESNAQLVSLFTRRFGAGQWSFLGLGSEKKWSSISEDSPQGEWDKLLS